MVGIVVGFAKQLAPPQGPPRQGRPQQQESVEGSIRLPAHLGALLLEVSMEQQVNSIRHPRDFEARPPLGQLWQPAQLVVEPPAAPAAD